MTILNLTVAAMVIALAPHAALAANTTLPSVKDQAQAACYDDVMSLCKDATPDEDKVIACMKVHHAQLSTPCRTIFDEGMKAKSN